MRVENSQYSHCGENREYSRPIILDIESSGFGRGSYPIEVGIALDDGQTGCRLIRPCSTWNHWDSAAEKLHGIKREVIEKNGRSVVEVASWLNHSLKGKAVYCDAWGNDSSWLALLFDCANMPQLFSLKPLYGLLTEAQVTEWHSAKNHIIASLGCPRHRASNDALILQQTYCKLERLAS